MKPGDLVSLSARGKRYHYLTDLYSAVGLVLKQKNDSPWADWIVLWSGWKGTLSHDRKNLKIVKNGCKPE